MTKADKALKNLKYHQRFPQEPDVSDKGDQSTVQALVGLKN